MKDVLKLKIFSIASGKHYHFESELFRLYFPGKCNDFGVMINSLVKTHSVILGMHLAARKSSKKTNCKMILSDAACSSYLLQCFFILCLINIRFKLRYGKPPEINYPPAQFVVSLFCPLVVDLSRQVFYVGKKKEGFFFFFLSLWCLLAKRGTPSVHFYGHLSN